MDTSSLMEQILSNDNLNRAYLQVVRNKGAEGVDGMKYTELKEYLAKNGEIIKEQLRIRKYKPQPVRRVEIPKPDGGVRNLGVPTVTDRFIQQAIAQVLTPIYEEQFHDHSYGFRPNHSVENAIARSYQLLQHANLHYVIEFDIKGFFDNVNHAKLIRQIWAMGIHDKQLIFVIRRILKAPIKLEDGTFITPDKGTPQGGIISPLLANIVLNELDHWVESQWQWCPICKRNARPENGFRQAKKSNLKEMFIVRYADDFRIFCRTKDSAERTKCAVTLWLKERLKLEISEKKTRIVNVRNHYSDFLGFKMKVHRKGNKLVVISHIADKNLEHKREKLKEQA